MILLVFSHCTRSADRKDMHQGADQSMNESLPKQDTGLGSCLENTYYLFLFFKILFPINLQDN